MMSKLKYYAFRVLSCTLLLPVAIIQIFFMLPLYYVIEALILVREFIIDNIGKPISRMLTVIIRKQNKLKEKMNDE